MRAQKETQEHVIGNRRKGDLCYVAAENLAEFCPMVVELERKPQLVRDEFRYLAEEISK